ncbi:MAG TPA: AarF/ABC1/UbiB kinase family protein, partial [Verrucomicrobiae bacterium]|nr:AarF/ABC1/UbiB kinase family protein [Verrucomicrobiae bacterium]
LSGLAAGLNPSLNILDTVKPYAKHLLGDEDASWWNLAWGKAKEVGGSLLALPPLMEKSLKQLQNGDIQVKTELGPLMRGIRFQAVLANRIVWALLLSVSAVIWTIFKVQGFALEARGAAYAAGVFAVLLLLNFRKKAERTFRVPQHGK